MATKELSYALSKGSLILVTGASGYIGSHVVNEALKAGFKVRGTARNEEKAENTKKIFKHDPNYSTAIVADFQEDGAFDEAVKGCDVVLHVASDTTFDTDPNKVVKPTVDGVVSILKSAAKESSVKRFVLTSSSAAVILPTANKELNLTVNDWNQEAVDFAWSPPPYTEDRAFAVYAASKTEGERAMWKFMKDEKPGFVANAILPNYNMGRILPGGSAGATGDGIINTYKGKLSTSPPQYMIDVIDCARLHVIAGAMDSTLKDERIFGFNVPFNWTQIIEIMKKLYPDAKVPEPPKDEPRDLTKVPNQLGADLLRKWYLQETGFKPIEESIKENLEGVV